MKKSATNTPILGAHMSIAGGLEQAIIRGDSIKCDAIQLFTKSNRQWHAHALSHPEIALFKETFSQATYVKHIVAHASYLINLASNTPDIREKSIHALAQEVARCEQLEIPYLVIHPGSGDRGTLDATLAVVAEGLDRALNNANGKTHILLETMAGQGNSIGSTFEQLASIYQKTSNKSLLGACVDTCHIFVAGYDITTDKGYSQVWRTFDDIVGIQHLKVIHLNDSKKSLGSKVDRHEAIGKGLLGEHTFKLLLEDPKLATVPKILETPKTSLADDERNLEELRSLLS